VNFTHECPYEDVDVAVCDATEEGRCHLVSNSVMDTHEGFDERISEGIEQPILVMIWDADATTACNEYRNEIYSSWWIGW
jgi:hypothetical protein